MMKKIIVLVAILALLSSIFLPLVSSSAGASSVPVIPQPDFLPGPTQTEGGSGSTLQNYLLNTGIPKALNIGIGLLFIAAFIALLVSAIQMLTAYGKEDQLNRAKTNLRYSILGLLFIILSYAIVSIIVSISLPTQESGTGFIPRAYAVNVTDDVNILLPNSTTIIHDDANRVSLPGGDFLREIVPAAVTNLMYAVAFLIFIAFLYGGSLMIVGRGNEDEVGKAKSIILYASISLAVISLGYAIIYGIATLQLNQDESTNKDDVFTQTTNE